MSNGNKCHPLLSTKNAFWISSLYYILHAPIQDPTRLLWPFRLTPGCGVKNIKCEYADHAAALLRSGPVDPRVMNAGENEASIYELMEYIYISRLNDVKMM